MKPWTEKLLSLLHAVPEKDSAYQIREDGQCIGHVDSEHIHIVQKPDRSGLTISVDSNCKGESVYIPVCITDGGLCETVSNDFYIDPGAEVTIVTGCGIHCGEGDASSHRGIHHFFIGESANVIYLEEHLGIGSAKAAREMNPETILELDHGAVLLMTSNQRGGVETAFRSVRARLQDEAFLIVRESLLTERSQSAHSDFDILLEGTGSRADLISRAVARHRSRQQFHSRICANAKCSAHSACDAILLGNGSVSAVPALTARHPEAALVHEAAIGKIAEEQIAKLMTLGLSRSKAEEVILEGFLRI